MRFRLLGEVSEVSSTGVANLAGLGPPKQRVVLAALLLGAGNPVSVDALTYAVWAEQPPDRSRNVLASYISRLRRILGRSTASPPAAIHHHLAGYTLACDPAGVDLHHFRAAAAQGRQALASGDDEGGLGLLDEALACWSGDALAGLPGLWASSTAAQLERERRDACAARITVLLNRRRAEDVLDELHRLAENYPLDEEFAGRLMAALDTAGRTAEAILQYHTLRNRLAAELGVDPSPSLQKSYVALLGQSSQAARTAATTPAAPAQLPPDIPSFTGRAGLLAELDRLAQPHAGTPAMMTCAITGGAGIGKTALAVHWAHRAHRWFPDGQLYLDLRGHADEPPVTSIDALRWFLRSLGLDSEHIPTPEPEAAALYRSLLADKRVLIVLDNAHHCDQVRPLLPAGPHSRVLITSRDPLAGLIARDDAHLLTVDVLTPTEARDLLQCLLRRRRAAIDPGAIDMLAETCGRMPLALRIAAAHLILRPNIGITAYIKALTGNDRVAQLHIPGDPHAAVRATFDLSYRRLSPRARRMFRLFGLHPVPDIGLPAAASLAGQPAALAQSTLAELVDAHLIREAPHGRYTTHDLLHAYAGVLAREHDREPLRRKAIHRMLDHYLHSACAATQHLDPHTDPAEIATAQPGVTPEQPAPQAAAAAWFAAEHHTLPAAVRLAAGAGFPTHTWQLSHAMARQLDRQGHWHEAAAIHRTALDSARRSNDDTGQAHAHRDLAVAYARLGRFDDAGLSFQRALTMYQSKGKIADQARAHRSLAWMLSQTDRNDQALDQARRALALFRATGHRCGEANALNAVGWFQTVIGEHRQAIVHCRQALAILAEIGNCHGQAHTWDSLGHAHHHLGHHRTAIACYRRAIGLYRRYASRYGEATSSVRLGDTYQAAGQTGAAHAAWKQGLAILEDLHHPDSRHVHTKLERQMAGCQRRLPRAADDAELLGE